MPHVSRLATRSLVLNECNINFKGPTALAIHRYYRLFDIKEPETRSGSGETRFVSIRFLNEEGTETTKFRYGRPLCAVLEMEAEIDVESLVVNLAFRTIAGEVTAECNNFVNPFNIGIKSDHKLVVEVTIKELTLNPGVYSVAALLLSENMVSHYDWVRTAATIEVEGGRPGTGGQQFMAAWKFKRVEIKKREDRGV